MKKCPFCGANIEESARFCLYCMQSLTEKEQIIPHQKKKPQWLMVIAAIVVPIIALAVVWFSGQITLENEASSDTSTDNLPVSEPAHTTTTAVTEKYIEPAHTPAAAVTEKYVDSSCTETGSYDEVVYCSVCREEISRTQKTIDKKPHDHNQKITTTEYLKTEATCTNSAVYYYSCSCGAIGDTTFTEGEATGHSFASTWDKNATHHWHNATCEHTTEISGKSEHNYGKDNICDTCGYTKTVDVPGATGGSGAPVGPGGSSASGCSHSSTRIERKNELDSTCTATGTYDEVIYCSTCGNELSKIAKTIPKKPHTEVIDKAVAPTCTGAGLTEGKHCSICATVLTAQQTVLATGHSFGKWVIDKAATCMETGTKHRICSVCDGSENGTIPVNATSHNYDTAWTINDTHHWHKCLNSGCTSVSNKTSHSFGEWTVDTVATCTKAGTRHHVCSGCQESVSGTYSNPDAHNYDTVWTADAAHHWYKCLNSGCTSVSNKTSHSFGEWIVDTVANCRISGKRHHVCTDCQKSVSEMYFDFSAHNYATEWTNDDTHHWHKCLNSGCTSVSNKTSHSFGEWIVDTAANCINEGKRHHVCTDCQKSVSETYSNPDAHNYDTAWIVDDTHHWHKCLNFGCTSTLEKIAHTITDGFCADCCVRSVDNEAYTRDGNYIYFGEYPQSLKADDVTITANKDVRGYYIGSDGYYYGKVFGNPFNTVKFQSGEYVQRKNYYFKVEPIRWRILSEDGDTAFILCDSIIANKPINSSSNNIYRYGSLRVWLNDKFYNTAFNEFQKCLINVSSVDEMNDKVFLLSYNDVTNTDYGFSSSDSTFDAARLMVVSDYARATGTQMFNDDNGFWWLRTLHRSASASYFCAYLVGDLGDFTYSGISGECFGVVPALQIQMSDNEYHLDEAGLAYKVNEDGTTCTITGIGTCTEAEVVIPSEINGLKVTGIGDTAFWGCTLTNITIPDSVMTIGDNTFGSCKNLASITIPASVTSIGDCAFDNSGLTSVTFDENSKLTSIGNFAFSNCSQLRSVSIPDSVTSIGEDAFHWCSRLTYVYITDLAAWCGISFDNYAANPLYGSLAKLYLNDQLITGLVIPTGVTSISEYAFYNYNYLKSVNFGENSQLTTIGGRAFYNCQSLSSITIPDDVTSIGDEAFKNCISLTSVPLPDSVTTIGTQSFYGCQSLTSVTIPANVTNIGDEAFYSCASLTNIKYRGTESQWQAITKGSNWNSNTGSYTITYDYVGEG